MVLTSEGYSDAYFGTPALGRASTDMRLPGRDRSKNSLREDEKDLLCPPPLAVVKAQRLPSRHLPAARAPQPPLRTMQMRMPAIGRL